MEVVKDYPSGAARIVGYAHHCIQEAYLKKNKLIVEGGMYNDVAKFFKEGKVIKFKIVFETHSEAMINRLGYLISQKGFNKDLVNVILVEKENQNSKFKQVGFTEEGYIEHWPIGFMSAED